MKLKAVVPKPAELGREALIIIGGAVLAALIIGHAPRLKAWIAAQWGDTPKSL